MGRTGKRRGKVDEKARQKERCRQASLYLEQSGKLKRQPCQRCGHAQAQRHHTDYSDPSAIVWLCRECHWLHHFEEMRAVFLKMLETARLAEESAAFLSVAR